MNISQHTAFKSLKFNTTNDLKQWDKQLTTTNPNKKTNSEIWMQILKHIFRQIIYIWRLF